MNALGEYVITLTCAAMICGVLPAFLPEGSAGKLVKLCCGVFLTVTALSPLVGWKLPDSLFTETDFRALGEAVAEHGREQAESERAAVIKEALEAYILDKAQQLGADIHVEIMLDEDDMPERVYLRGSGSAEALARLTEEMETQLGIPKERQQWTGRKQEP